MAARDLHSKAATTSWGDRGNLSSVPTLFLVSCPMCWGWGAWVLPLAEGPPHPHWMKVGEMLHWPHRARTCSLCQLWVPWSMQEALAVEWDRLVVSILQQEWDLKAAWELGMVGQGQSLGSSDDVCIIFHPSSFCKPFFPPHPPTWHPPPSLLCTMDMEDTPYVTAQTHPSGPKALVLQVLPCAWGHRQWGWRWLWEEVPMSST